MPKPKTIGEYVKELEGTRKDKPDQIREALQIYIELWRSVIEKGIVDGSDTVEEALSKVEQSGGLVSAASATSRSESAGRV